MPLNPSVVDSLVVFEDLYPSLLLKSGVGSGGGASFFFSLACWAIASVASASNHGRNGFTSSILARGFYHGTQNSRRMLPSNCRDPVALLITPKVAAFDRFVPGAANTGVLVSPMASMRI